MSKFHNTSNLQNEGSEFEEVESNVEAAPDVAAVPTQQKGNISGTDEMGNIVNSVSRMKNIHVDSLNIPTWLKSALNSLDTNGDGLEQDEVEEVLRVAALQKKLDEENGDEIFYKRFPESIQKVMEIWDTDGSGTICSAELAAAAAAQKKLEEESNMLKKALGFLVVILIILCVMNFAMAYAAAETAKDFRPKSVSVPSSLSNLRMLAGAKTHAVSLPPPGVTVANSSGAAPVHQQTKVTAPTSILGPSLNVMKTSAVQGVALVGNGQQLKYTGCQASKKYTAPITLQSSKVVNSNTVASPKDAKTFALFAKIETKVRRLREETKKAGRHLTRSERRRVLAGSRRLTGAFEAGEIVAETVDAALKAGGETVFDLHFESNDETVAMEAEFEIDLGEMSLRRNLRQKGLKPRKAKKTPKLTSATLTKKMKQTVRDEQGRRRLTEKKIKKELYSREKALAKQRKLWQSVEFPGTPNAMIVGADSDYFVTEFDKYGVQWDPKDYADTIDGLNKEDQNDACEDDECENQECLDGNCELTLLEELLGEQADIFNNFEKEMDGYLQTDTDQTASEVGGMLANAAVTLGSMGNALECPIPNVISHVNNIPDFLSDFIQLIYDPSDFEESLVEVIQAAGCVFATAAIDSEKIADIEEKFVEVASDLSSETQLEFGISNHSIKVTNKFDNKAMLVTSIIPMGPNNEGSDIYLVTIPTDGQTLAENTGTTINTATTTAASSGNTGTTDTATTTAASSGNTITTDTATTTAASSGNTGTTDTATTTAASTR